MTDLTPRRKIGIRTCIVLSSARTDAKRSRGRARATLGAAKQLGALTRATKYTPKEHP